MLYITYNNIKFNVFYYQKVEKMVIIMKSFRETLKEELKNSAFKKEYEALAPEYQIIREMIKARNEKDLTQVELSNLTGISQADISRLENGEANPTVSMLDRLASAFNKKLQIQFA